MTARISGLLGGRRCRDVGYGTPFGPPTSDRCGEPFGDVGVCTAEDAKTNIEEEGEEEYGDEDNGELGLGVSTNTGNGTAALSETVTYD